MTNKIIILLLFLTTPFFQCSAMEKTGDKTKQIHDQANFKELALWAIQTHNISSYSEMHKFIIANCNVSNQYYFFNNICKHIAWENESFDIFADELKRIAFDKFIDKNELQMFFNQFCIKLKLNIITTIIEDFAQAPITEEMIDFICDRILNIARELNSIEFTCRLAIRLRMHKSRIMLEDFNALHLQKRTLAVGNLAKKDEFFKELIECPLFQILQKLCVTICDLAIEAACRQEQNYIDCKPSLNGKALMIFNSIFLDQRNDSTYNRQSKPADNKVPSENRVLVKESLSSAIKNLSSEDRNEIVKYLFSSFFVLHSDRLSASQNINKKLSLIYNNYEASIYKLNDEDLNKRIDNLIIVYNNLKHIRPKALQLSIAIRDSRLLGPMAKSIYYLNNHITECMALKIVQNIVKMDIVNIKNHLEFMLINFGINFFKKGLLLIASELRLLMQEIEVQDDKKNKLFLVAEQLTQDASEVFLKNSPKNSEAKFIDKIFANSKDN